MRNASGLSLDRLAYAALLATIGVGAAGFIGPLAAPAELLYPLVATLAAALLLWRRPALYLGFTWWVWFLTPEVRRLIDYRVGYTESSLVMLAPFLVSGVALLAVFSRLSHLPRAYRLPFSFVAIGLLYAYGVGVLYNGLVTASLDLLTWGVPVIIGAYVLTHTHHAAAFREVTRRAFIWGLLIMGLYGAVQYFYLPAWDGYWMDNAAIWTIGSSEPLQVRVFSTLNSPGPYAVVMMAGLLLIFTRGGFVTALGAGAGFLGFALAIVRATWVGWLVGFIVVAASLPLRLRTRLLGTLFLLVLIAIPAFTVGPVAELLSQRLQSFTDLGSDTSFNERLELYASLPEFTAGNPLGQGLGSTGVASNQSAALQNLDSGVIAVVYSFGILGTLYFVGGAAALFSAALRGGLRSNNVTDASYIGITVAAIVQLAFGNAWGGVTGMILWVFPCLYLASRYQAELEHAQVRGTEPATLAQERGYSL